MDDGTRLRDTPSGSNAYGHISRVDGDRRLAQHANQESYWSVLLETYPQLRTIRPLRTAEADTDQLHESGTHQALEEKCLFALRKLREGIVASGRHDKFAIDVFERTALYAILADHPESYVPCLKYLLDSLYTTMEDKHSMENLHLLHLCSLDTLSDFVTARVEAGERRCTADDVFQAIARNNWLRLTYIRKRANRYERALLQRQERRLTNQALLSIASAYHFIDVEWLTSKFEHWKHTADEKSWSVVDDRCIFRRPRSRA